MARRLFFSWSLSSCEGVKINSLGRNRVAILQIMQSIKALAISPLCKVRCCKRCNDSSTEIILKLLIKKGIVHLVVELHVYSIFALETKFFEAHDILTYGGGRRPWLELLKSRTSLLHSLIVLAEVWHATRKGVKLNVT